MLILTFFFFLKFKFLGKFEKFVAIEIYALTDPNQAFVTFVLSLITKFIDFI